MLISLRMHNRGPIWHALGQQVEAQTGAQASDQTNNPVWDVVDNGLADKIEMQVWINLNWPLDAAVVSAL